MKHPITATILKQYKAWKGIKLFGKEGKNAV